jgi:hypothetical protein
MRDKRHHRKNHRLVAYWLFKNRQIPNIILYTAVNELSSEFADVSTSNKQQADDFSEDDVCRAFCIPPIDKNYFDKTHFLSLKFKYF